MWHPLRALDYRGYELEVAGLLFDRAVEIYNRETNTFAEFDRTATYHLRSPRDTIFLRAEGVDEMIGFSSMVLSED